MVQVASGEAGFGDKLRRADMIGTHTNSIRALCDPTAPVLAPYLLRTRVERAVFGLICELADASGSARPDGLDPVQVSVAIPSNKAGEIARSLSLAFSRFTYLCDTSNWSDDGQDPRILECRDDLLDLCDRAEHELRPAV